MCTTNNTEGMTEEIIETQTKFKLKWKLSLFYVLSLSQRLKIQDDEDDTQVTTLGQSLQTQTLTIGRSRPFMPT